VIAAASTGIARISNTEVKKIAHTNKFKVLKYIPSTLKLIIVVMKLIEAKIEEVPTK
jgi:hypothetical protein